MFFLLYIDVFHIMRTCTHKCMHAPMHTYLCLSQYFLHTIVAREQFIKAFATPSGCWEVQRHLFIMFDAVVLSLNTASTRVAFPKYTCVPFFTHTFIYIYKCETCCPAPLCLSWCIKTPYNSVLPWFLTALSPQSGTKTRVSQEHQHSHRVLAMKDAMLTDCATT